MWLLKLKPFPRIRWLLAVVLLVGLDQATKAYFAATLPLGAAVEVTTWFNLVHVLNTGAAFSMLADAGGWQRYFLIAVSLILVVMVSGLCLMKDTTALDRWVGAMAVGGGTGNLIDRIQTGAVVDFLDIHWRGLHWPAFNLADVWVVTAACVWVLLSLRSNPKASEPTTKAAP